MQPDTLSYPPTNCLCDWLLNGKVVEKPNCPLHGQYQKLLKRVEADTVYKIHCSDCECYGDDFFSAEQAAEFSARDGWRVLGDNARAVCDTCAKGYSPE